MELNFTDLYISYPGHPNFNSSKFLEDDTIRVIIQKYEMLIFTNKGDVFGKPDFGANLLELLHATQYSAQDVEEIIRSQISTYVSELASLEYTLTVNFFQHPERFEEFMVIDLSFNGLLVSAIIQ